MKKLLAAVVCSLFVIAVFEFFSWSRRSLVTGLNLTAAYISGALILLIVGLLCLKVFRWLRATWWKAVDFTPAFLFLIGALTWLIGEIIKAPVIRRATYDIQIYDTYYVIARPHIMTLTGILFALFSGIYYGVSALFKFTWNSAIGYTHFGVTLIGTYFLFWPENYQEYLVTGKNRPYLDHSSIIEYNQSNQLQLSMFLLIVSVQFLFIFYCLYSLFRKRRS